MEGEDYIIKDGTWLVYTEAGLIAWADAIAAASNANINCTLEADITLERKWTPVCTTYSTAYRGTFDGNGHTIFNLVINVTDENNTGFLGYITSRGEVSNLTLEKPTISGASYVGGIAGENWGTITNCTVSNGIISGSSPVGGIAGYAANADTTGCIVSGGTVKGSGGHVGGIIGNALRSAVTGCTNSSSVIGSLDAIGGIVGYLGESSTAEKCDNSGTVSGNINVGGIVGYITVHGTVTECNNSGTVSASSNYAGGIVGYSNANNASVTITGCDNSGAVSGSNYVGGVVGYNGTYGTVTDCTWVASTATAGIGGGTTEGDNISGVESREE